MDFVTLVPQMQQYDWKKCHLQASLYSRYRIVNEIYCGEAH